MTTGECAHTHTFSTDNLRSQMHKFCQVFLKEWVIQLRVPRAGESLRKWTKSCRIQDQSSRISCHIWKEREGTGGWENRGRDSVHLRMMPQTSQQGDLVAQIVDPSQRRVENDNIQWGSECMDRAWIMCIDRLCLRSCRNRTLILRWNQTTRAHRCPVWGFASTFGHVSLPCWPLG